MKSLIILAVISVASCATISQWEEFKLKFKKGFRSNAHEEERKAIFMSTLESIEEHNAKYENGLSTYFQGVNYYSDWTWEEFEETLLNGVTFNTEVLSEEDYLQKSKTAAPDAMDWRDTMGKVKNQGQCGSCWAFAQVGTVEAAWALDGNEKVVLAEQMMLDCGSGSCQGGSLTGAFNTIIDKEGAALEEDYPYRASDGHSCKYEDSMKAASISSYKHVHTDVDSFMDAMASQPIAIGLYVNSNFQRYSGGIFDDPSCPQNKANHAVIAVAYDTNEGSWTIRNSWGGHWGEDGHIRIVMGKNTCNCEKTESTVPQI